MHEYAGLTPPCEKDQHTPIPSEDVNNENINIVNMPYTDDQNEPVYWYTSGQRNVVRNKMWWVQSPDPIPFMPAFKRWTESFLESEQQFEPCLGYVVVNTLLMIGAKSSCKIRAV